MSTSASNTPNKHTKRRVVEKQSKKQPKRSGADTSLLAGNAKADHMFPAANNNNSTKKYARSVTESEENSEEPNQTAQKTR